MNLRKREVPFTLRVLLVASAFAGIAVLVMHIVSISFDPTHNAYKFVTNNYVAGLLIAIVVGTFTALWGLRRGLCLPWPVFGDDRPTVPRSDLTSQFQTDASCRPLEEAGWRLSGGGVHTGSTVTYQRLMHPPFTFAAQFRPRRRHADNNFWRTGLGVSDEHGKELMQFHIDNHNLIVAYVMGKRVLQTPAAKTLEDKWSILMFQISPVEGNEGTILRADAHIDGESFFLGYVPVCAMRCEILAWSDSYMRHLVDVRDVTIRQPIA